MTTRGMSLMMAMRRACLALILLLGLTSVAAAHAALNGTDPIDGAVLGSAPERLVLTFSEPVSPLALRLIRPGGAASELTVFEVRGQTVEIAAPPDLAEGTHMLTWRVVSADGHPVGGTLIFSIGQPSAAPPPVADAMDGRIAAGLWVTKLALYLGLFVGVGGAFAIAWLVPQSRSGERVAGAALALGLGGALLAPGFQGLDALGASPSRFLDPLVWTTGMQTSFGWTVLAAMGAQSLAAIALLSSSVKLGRALSFAAMLAGAGSLALSGHASAAAPQWLMRPAVFLHALTIAAWIGALAPLALALRGEAPDATSALNRFSAAIPPAVAMLVAAGLTLAFVQVQHPSALATTDYGRLLLAKLALLVALFALAARNRWRLTKPALAGGRAPRQAMVRSIAIETMLVLLVFAVAAGWRFTPPPRALAIAAAQPAQIHIHTDKAMADVTIAPARAGPVSVSAVVMTGDFGPLDAREVTFVFANPAAGIENIRRRAERRGDGTWRADDVVLPLPGAWTVRLDILITDFDLARIEGEVEIRP